MTVESAAELQANIEVLDPVISIKIFEKDFEKKLKNNPLQKQQIFNNAIKKSWNKCVEGILETGYLFYLMKKKYTKKAFKKAKNELGFTTRTVDRLVKIYEDDRIKTHVSILPSSWGTLHELTRLDDNTFKNAVKSGQIHIDMQRKDVAILLDPDKYDPGNKPENPYKGKIKSIVVYLDEADQEIFDNVLKKIKSVKGVDVDSSYFNQFCDREDKKQSLEFEKQLKRGRRAAINYIKELAKKIIAVKGKKLFEQSYKEYKDFFAGNPYRKDLVEYPCAPNGENEIDNMLSVMGSDKTCEQFEQKEMEA